MPTNLNALLRYKTIDRCLTNKFNRCTIDLLISQCSESLSNLHGVNTSVSERTIRNDIRILRSNILGFNAPIIFENGYYKYDDDNYSIFNKIIYEIELLIEIQELLVEEFDLIKSKHKGYLVTKLARITNVKIPKKCFEEDTTTLLFDMSPTVNNKEDITRPNYSSYPKIYEIKRNFFGKQKLVELKMKEYFSWQYIFEVV